jgi:S-adenosylmethionine uptake transporter|tara:strand:+ start:80352 stop:81077 length:726 start_codon:yes stop_codon:yes gene_type:complete
MPALPILLAIGGIAALCLMDALVKQISLTEAVVTAAWLRYLFGTLTTIPLVILLRRRLPPRARWPRHLFRGVIMAVMGYLFFFAISALPLAETLAITFIAPLLVPPLGALFLGERIRLGAALAGLVGFVGVLVTLNGGDMTTPQASELRLLGIGAALVSALLYAVQSILLREMAQRDDPDGDDAQHRHSLRLRHALRAGIRAAAGASLPTAGPGSRGGRDMRLSAAHPRLCQGGGAVVDHF